MKKARPADRYAAPADRYAAPADPLKKAGADVGFVVDLALARSALGSARRVLSALTRRTPDRRLTNALVAVRAAEIEIVRLIGETPGFPMTPEIVADLLDAMNERPPKCRIPTPTPSDPVTSSNSKGAPPS